MNFLLLEEVDSTNSYVTVHSRELEPMTMVIADRQTAGRGQRGNSWESQPGANLTFTLFHRPEGIAPRDQFVISEAVALAIADYLAEEQIMAKVKWPNDIYVGDKKIAGILIEHSIVGSRIEHTRIGVGLNVNQMQFLSDAPNPVSMAQLTEAHYDTSRVAASAGAHLEARLHSIESAEGAVRTHAEFCQRLWRGDGKPHPFRTPGGKPFFATIHAISPHGLLTLKEHETPESQERLRTFHFKEVEYIL